ncbi:S1/P1 nuclease [Filimonas effusa]|uniref:S1/P1 Nuclease n=1 Tax=Filimonas effusa TaxID=2508721 RepID=A0A4Q1DB84_9BACT|nr:S1/P1 nuclease [Filimonas effusa]RXK86035.1 S1/P1 Nuclease [Filimonas effusa]
MNRYVVSLTIIAFSIIHLSWGAKGHRTVAFIAEKHLSPKAKAAVTACLQGEAIENAATWPDENRTNENAQWHFINLPLGLNYEKFVTYVKGQNGTIYTAYLDAKATLANNNASAAQKHDALRFVIHLVGDAHQPMHVSRKEDKGGNTIQVRFNGEGTNLHSLWDSRLISYEGLTEAQMADHYDNASKRQVAKWQNDDIMQWLWESYQLSSHIYKKTASGQEISKDYYKKNIKIIHKRIAQAGIRLAGELNKIFN